jgi:transposase
METATEIEFFVGIDWGSEAHQVCVLSAQREVLEELSVAHTGKAIRELADALVRRAGGDASRIAVAIETPHGAVVETLRDRGIRVFVVNPKQLDRFRDRHTVAGAKDDRRDAFVLADSLRTDSALFREVKLTDARVVELRELVRMHEDLGAERTALANRLREQVHRFYPQVLELGSVHEDRWLWASLQRAPTPSLGRGLSSAKIDTILKAHAIRRWTVDAVRDVLRTTALHVAPGVEQACVRHIKKLLPRLRLVHEQQTECEREIRALLDELEEPAATEERRGHRDAAILRSLPGVGTIVGATMLAEAYEPLVRRDYSSLRALCGAAPVTHQSGKRRDTSMRRACNARLRNAVHHMAMNCVNRDERAKKQYAALRAKGHSHGRALRGVADRLLALLVVMLKNGTLFDETKRHVPRAA